MDLTHINFTRGLLKMETRKLRDIPVHDSAGNRYNMEEMQDVRWVKPLSGPAQPSPRMWYQCNGIEFTPDGLGYRNERTLLMPVNGT